MEQRHGFGHCGASLRKPLPHAHWLDCLARSCSSRRFGVLRVSIDALEPDPPHSVDATGLGGVYVLVIYSMLQEPV